MTPEERIAKLEAKVEGVESWVKSIDEKMDKLLEAAAMGKGAWWAILKVGGIAVALASAGAWIWSNFPKAH
jgi:hypothetical protein